MYLCYIIFCSKNNIIEYAFNLTCFLGYYLHFDIEKYFVFLYLRLLDDLLKANLIKLAELKPSKKQIKYTT
jgi:hypothetical protein